MNVTFLRDVKMKSDGSTIIAGTKATVEFQKFVPVAITHRRTVFDVTLPSGKVISTSKMNLFFKEPSVRTLQKWSNDGVAKSVTGKKCEPDGYGPDGSPSWFLVLGLI